MRQYAALWSAGAVAGSRIAVLLLLCVTSTTAAQGAAGDARWLPAARVADGNHFVDRQRVTWRRGIAGRFLVSAWIREVYHQPQAQRPWIRESFRSRDIRYEFDCDHDRFLNGEAIYYDDRGREVGRIQMPLEELASWDSVNPHTPAEDNLEVACSYAMARKGASGAAAVEAQRRERWRLAGVTDAGVIFFDTHRIRWVSAAGGHVVSAWVRSQYSTPRTVSGVNAPVGSLNVRFEIDCDSSRSYPQRARRVVQRGVKNERLQSHETSGEEEFSAVAMGSAGATYARAMCDYARRHLSR